MHVWSVTIALADYIADNAQNLLRTSPLAGFLKDWLNMLFLSRVLRALPSPAIILLRHLFNATQRAVFGKFADDFERVILKRSRNHPLDGKSTYFVIMNFIETNELFGHESQLRIAATAKDFRGLYDTNIAKVRKFCRLHGRAAAQAGLDIPFWSRTPLSLRCAMHHRLLSIAKEEKLLGNIKVKDIPIDGQFSTILSTTYEQMKPINAEIRQSFADTNFVDTLFDDLDLTAIGATITTIAEGMKVMDISRMGIEVTEEYRVAR